MTSPPSRRSFLVATGVAFGLVRAARAQSTVGWTELSPVVVGDEVSVVAVGAAHDDDGPLAAARLAARRRALERAMAMLSRWADDALSRSSATPREAQATHDALSAHAAITRVRPRADGSAVVEVRCPLQPLRDAFDARGTPWHRSSDR